MTVVIHIGDIEFEVVSDVGLQRGERVGLASFLPLPFPFPLSLPLPLPLPLPFPLPPSFPLPLPPLPMPFQKQETFPILKAKKNKETWKIKVFI